METALRILRGMAHAGPFRMHEAVEEVRAIAWIAALLAIVWLAPNTQQILARHEPGLDAVPEGRRGWEPTRRWALVVAVIFVLAVLQISHISEFIYFQF